MKTSADQTESRRTGIVSSQRGFTLLEILLALIVLSLVLTAVHSIFNSALDVRNRTEARFSDAIPLQRTLDVIKRDIANLTAPGGTLTGTIQTTPTDTMSSTMTHSGLQCGPTLYTASGTLSEYEPWSEMRKVTYYLSPATNRLPGNDLIRSVTRNLLPVNVEEFVDQTLMSGVDSLRFEYYNGTSWVDTWDSTTSTTTSESNAVPVGVRVQLTLISPKGVIDQDPIEMVIPIGVQPGTNTVTSASSASSSGGNE